MSQRLLVLFAQSFVALGGGETSQLLARLLIIYGVLQELQAFQMKHRLRGLTVFQCVIESLPGVTFVVEVTLALQNLRRI